MNIAWQGFSYSSLFPFTCVLCCVKHGHVWKVEFSILTATIMQILSKHLSRCWQVNNMSWIRISLALPNLIYSFNKYLILLFILCSFRTTGEVLQLEVWRTTPPIQSRSANHHCQNRHVPLQEPIPPPPPKSSSVAVANTSTARPIPNINEGRQHQQTPASATITTTTTIDNSLKRNINANANINQGHVVSAPAAAASTPKSRTQSSQPPPTSILKPPPPAPPTTLGKSGGENTTSQPQQSQPGSSSWRIRFNIEVGQGTYV